MTLAGPVLWKIIDVTWEVNCSVKHALFARVSMQISLFLFQIFGNLRTLSDVAVIPHDESGKEARERVMLTI